MKLLKACCNRVVPWFLFNFESCLLKIKKKKKKRKKKISKEYFDPKLRPKNRSFERKRINFAKMFASNSYLSELGPE